MYAVDAVDIYRDEASENSCAYKLEHEKNHRYKAASE
jgi:hypothetical protein